MSTSSVVHGTVNNMLEAPKSTLPDEALDKAKCREAVEDALKIPESAKAFDRHAWLAKTKEHDTLLLNNE